MAVLNKVLLIGRVGSDPQLRYTKEGKAVCKFALAVRSSFSDDSVEFFDVTTWEAVAETCAEYLQKGRLIFLEGRLRKSSWEKDGQKRVRYEITASTVQFLDRPRKAEEPPDANAPAEAPPEPEPIEETSVQQPISEARGPA